MFTNDQMDSVRRRIPGAGMLPGAGFLNDRLNDVVVLLTALPEISVHLRTIAEHVVHLDDEIVRMRIAVDRLETEVHELRGDIGELGGEMSEVKASVARLEPHISDISRLARPLKRMRSRAAERHAHDLAELSVAPEPGRPGAVEQPLADAA